MSKKTTNSKMQNFEDLEGDVHLEKFNGTPIDLPKLDIPMEVPKKTKKTEPELTELEQRIIAYESKNQNIPALSAMFRVSEATIKEILSKKK